MGQEEGYGDLYTASYPVPGLRPGSYVITVVIRAACPRVRSMRRTPRRRRHPVGETSEGSVQLTDHQVLLSPEPASANHLHLGAGTGMKTVMNRPQFAMTPISMSLGC